MWSLWFISPAVQGLSSPSPVHTSRSLVRAASCRLFLLGSMWGCTAALQRLWVAATFFLQLRGLFFLQKSGGWTSISLEDQCTATRRLTTGCALACQRVQRRGRGHVVAMSDTEYTEESKTISRICLQCGQVVATRAQHKLCKLEIQGISDDSFQVLLLEYICLDDLK